MIMFRGVVVVVVFKTKGKIKMTNKEYIEKNNISFSESMKMYDNEKYPCINDWLNQEYQEHKFKVGDFVILKGDTTGIGLVVDVKDKVYYKFLYRSGNFARLDRYYGDSNYHRTEHDVFFMEDESRYENIF